MANTAQDTVNRWDSGGEFGPQIVQVLAVRLALLSGLFVLVAVLSQAPGRELKVLAAAYPLLVVAYGVSALYAVLLRQRPASRLFLMFQFLVDAACIAVLLERTGGALGNLFSMLFVFNILGAGYLLALRGALIIAAVDSLAFLVMSEPWGLSQQIGVGDNFVLVQISQQALHVLAFFLTAMVSGQLSQRTRASAEALARLSGLYAMVVESLDAGVITLDLKGNITSANAMAENILGLELPALRGQSLDLLLEGAEVEEGSLLQAEQGQERRSRWSCWYVDPRDQRKYLVVVESDLRDLEQGPIGRTVVLDDRTINRSLEERLERDKRLTQVGRLAAGIAHEIRNPLTAMRGSLEILAEGKRPDATERLLSILTSETRRLGRLVDDFLALSNPRKGAREAVEVDKILGRVVEVLANDSRAKDVELLLEGEKGLVVLANPDGLHQILLNLAINSVLAMGNSGTIGVRVEAKEGTVSMDLQDDGPGVDPSDRHRIFDPFFTRRTGGVGLGLALARSIAEENGGNLELVDSTKGARFVVSLPRWYPPKEAKA